MKAHLLNLVDPRQAHIAEINAVLSIKPFVYFIEAKIASGNGVRKQQLQYVVDKIKQCPGWDQPIDRERIEDYREILELIYITLSAPIVDEDENVWAMAVPFTPQVLFGTNALYNLLEDYKGSIKNNIIDTNTLAEKEAIKFSVVYSAILQKLYGMSLVSKHEMIHHIMDDATGMNKYYKVDFDSRFVEVHYKGVLPEINFEKINLLEDSGTGSKYETLNTIRKLLPLDQFRFEGFSIIRIKDITEQQVIENIKDMIVNLSPNTPIYNEISEALKELMGNNQLEVNLMPVLKVNDRLVTNCFEGHNSELIATCQKFNLPMQLYINSIESYVRDPRLIFRKDISVPEEQEDEMFARLRKIGIHGVAVIPVFFQKELVGVLSIFSRQKDVLSESLLPMLEPAIPLLEQLLQTTIDDFKITLDNIVKNKFTLLQPSVEWKFNEVAFDYLLQSKEDKKAEIGQIFFENVYPLYGAIDIRNSTQERNNALRADMLHQLDILKNVLQKLGKERDLGLTNELIFKTDNWLKQINDFITSDDEFNLNLFFENEANPFLVHFRQSHPRTAGVIDDYFRAIAPGGSTFANRSALESSLQTLNQTISNMLDQMNVDIQSAYPYYFEKYRSDGIEYDIYIGQSITPGKPYHSLYLKNLRLWQLNSMAMIAKLTHSLKTQLPKQLQTTQLIFIHANTIDISFRNDEHRFDVEGAYNIRYEMIKKRIDKVLVKDTGERLTQPGKIALVYFQPKDVEEYLSHIHYLQSRNILTDEVEFLELEELQGVNGLKAIRVNVVIDEEQEGDIPEEIKALLNNKEEGAVPPLNC